ncbi:Uncharacterised protein [Streptomyces griseus]|nr:Uncharacterised protein [Streptomyces griseus]
MWNVRSSGLTSPGGQLTGVQREPGVRVLGAQVLEHPHLEAVVAQGALRVLRLDEVDGDEPRVALRQPHPDGHLREHALVRTRAGDLGDPPDGKFAAGVGTAGVAVGRLPELGVGGVRLAHGLGDDRVELAAGHQLAVEGGEVGVVADGLGELLRGVRRGSDQGLQVELVLLDDGVGDIGEHLAAITRRFAELAEGVEEVVVAGLVGGEVLHGPGADDPLTELRVGAGLGGRPRPRPAGRTHRGVGGVDAQAVLTRESNQVLGGHRTREVVVEVAALGQRSEELLEPGRTVAQRVETGVGHALGGGREAARRLRAGAGRGFLHGCRGRRHRGEEREGGEETEPGREQGRGTVSRPNR